MFLVVFGETIKSHVDVDKGKVPNDGSSSFVHVQVPEVFERQSDLEVVFESPVEMG